MVWPRFDLKRTKHLCEYPPYYRVGMARHDTHPRDEAVQAPAGEDPAEYLELLLTQFEREVTVDGTLELHEFGKTGDEPRYFCVRVRNAENGGVTVVSRPTSMDAGEMEAWIRAAALTARDGIDRITVDR